MLLETSAAITSTLDLGQLLLTLADQLLRVSGFSICSIYDWDQKAGEARTMAEHSHAVWSVDSPELFRIKDFPTTERVLTTGEPAVVHLGMDDPELIWMREAGLAAILMLPLYAGDQTIGLVEIGSPNSESIFDEATVLRCRQILQEAAPGFAAPFQDNPGEALLSLARQLLESSGASSCSISEWLRSRAEVRTAAEYSHMTWPLGQGPAWKLAEWPSVGRVLASRLPSVARLSDPDAEPLDREDLELYRARALVLLPILMKGEPIGFVEMYDVADERNVGHDELRLWQGVVSQAAVAIENAKLHAQVRKQLEVETALREAGTVFTSTLEPHVVLSLIAEQMGQAVDATSAYICGFDPAKMRSAVLAEYIGPQANRREGISDLGACYVEADDEGEGEFLRCMQTGQIDISQIDDPELTDTERAHMNEYGARTVLYIPLRVKGKLIGFTELWESRHRREFTADEIALCQAIAQNAAIALDNAQLYEQMEASLREKEVLLQEIHHRVKNNLQVISSLLNLQAGGLEDTRALDALRDSQGRVRSIALVHEKLYQSPDLAHIDFAAYTRELASALLRSYDAHTQGIALSTQIDDVLLGIDTAIPCGLILGELVSNALKHAFPGKRSGEITVGLRARSGETILTVGDDGIGLPADLDFRSPESLGLELVTTLVQQLDGTIELDGREGTLFKISFAPGTEERI
jgi:two-component sensor histidine kinase